MYSTVIAAIAATSGADRGTKPNAPGSGRYGIANAIGMRIAGDSRCAPQRSFVTDRRIEAATRGTSRHATVASPMLIASKAVDAAGGSV